MFKRSTDVTQTESGKAWEYGLAQQCADIANPNAVLIVNGPRQKAQQSYNLLSDIEKLKIDRAANEVVVFLRTHDPRLVDTTRVLMQSDMMGAKGDVRDILLDTAHGIVGISAKHRHKALKHSRLSDQIDFGEQWYGKPCSNRYWASVLPTFDGLRRNAGLLWKDLPNKHGDIYLPILDAFIKEVSDYANPKEMMCYLLGRHDFYKVIKENGDVSIQSFNMNGSLKWGSKTPLPDQVIQIAMKPRSKTTAVMTMDRGWQVSFRIHNANSYIEPSLKFDIQLEGSPQTLSRHQIPYN